MLQIVFLNKTLQMICRTMKIKMKIYDFKDLSWITSNSIHDSKFCFKVISTLRKISPALNFQQLYVRFIKEGLIIWLQEYYLILFVNEKGKIS